MGQTPSISLPSSLPDLALHVLRTAENSPSYGLLEPFFDYLVGLDSSSADSQQSLSTEALGRILADNEGGRVVLKVYNAKSQRIRGVSILLPFLTVAWRVRLMTRCIFITHSYLGGRRQVTIIRPFITSVQPFPCVRKRISRIRRPGG